MSQEKVDLKRQETQFVQHAAQMASIARGDPDEEIVVPVTTVQLPSLGKIYSVESPLHGLRQLDLKSMTAKEEDIITSLPLLRQGKAMTMLMKSCIIDKSIDPDDMVVGDRNALLIAIRVSGYGAEYSGKVTCPECTETFEHEFNLANVPMHELKEDPVQPGTNLFYYELPVTKKRVSFKLLTGADERELQTLADRARKAKGVGAQESNVTMKLLHHVVSIDSTTDRQKLARMIKNLPAKDSLKLRKYIDTISPGVNLTKFVQCPACGEESEVAVPLGADFFWPELG